MTHSKPTEDFLKTLTVLYVEDDIDVRDQLAQYLRRRVGTLLIAENGALGLEAYHRDKPDMIITDILMPTMDGLDMASEIRKIDFGIPIIITTAFEQPSILMRSIEVGIDKYVTKPVNTGLLLHTILQCADRLNTLEQLRLAAKVFENSLEAILITDTENVIRWVNRAFTETTGYLPEEAIGRNPQLLSSGKQDATFYQAMWADINTKGSWKGEIWNRRKNGEIYPEWLSVNVLRGARGKVTHYVGIFSDISERKAAEEQIRHLAQHDPLTGLPNRNLLRDRMEVALANASRKQEKVALLMLDLDEFKLVNDTYGHETGDKLLVEVSHKLEDLFRASDTVCRLGGDEFVVVINEVLDAADAVSAAEKILLTIRPELEIEGRAMGISPSIGIALFPNDGNEMDGLLRNADIAMYAAKRAGGNGFRFFSDGHPSS